MPSSDSRLRLSASRHVLVFFGRRIVQYQDGLPLDLVPIALALHQYIDEDDDSPCNFSVDSVCLPDIPPECFCHWLRVHGTSGIRRLFRHRPALFNVDVVTFLGYAGQHESLAFLHGESVSLSKAATICAAEQGHEATVRVLCDASYYDDGAYAIALANGHMEIVHLLERYRPSKRPRRFIVRPFSVM
ncbi:Aste57867_14948 [Aphanomyces stellatus]|uniref:Aste57867_14948 protein n=1 Tax=Aphanomyces stellatus TaxID=120398 RepID=A0A485L2V7_9STRA|nr:hypothetical protein As57867_014892 [Aphanomyces stellatus]VFT91762.1 Aste57867_14948 [Aphanomyces stellatus]